MARGLDLKKLSIDTDSMEKTKCCSHQKRELPHQDDLDLHGKGSAATTASTAAKENTLAILIVDTEASALRSKQLEASGSPLKRKDVCEKTQRDRRLADYGVSPERLYEVASVAPSIAWNSMAATLR